MSSKGAKRSRRVSGEAPEAPAVGGEGGARGGGSASAAFSAAPASSSTALVRSRRRSSTAAEDGGGGAGGALAPGITLEMSRFVEEQLRGLQRDHARELAAVHREFSAFRSVHSRLAGELACLAGELAAVRRDHESKLSDLRYDNSRLCALLGPSSDWTEVGMVCRRHGSGLDAYREYRSVMSVLFNAHAYDLSEGFMRFFTTGEARKLRLVHSEFLDAVTATPWHDMDTIIAQPWREKASILGPTAAWRECFPNAQAACVDGLVVSDASVAYFRGLRSLKMDNCRQLSDAAFVNLRGLDSLIMWKFSQPRITSSAFLHLKGIQELYMWSRELAFLTEVTAVLPEARSLSPGILNNLFDNAIAAVDVPECRRLLATRALGSACWLYAGTTFLDLPAPATAQDVIATACLELLHVGLEVGSARLVLEATMYIVTATQDDLGKAACIAAGSIPAIVTAIDDFRTDPDACAELCIALSAVAASEAGQRACKAAGAARPLVSALKYHAEHDYFVEKAFDAIADLCHNSDRYVTSLVELKVVHHLCVAFEKCKIPNDLCSPFSRALRNITRNIYGVSACLADEDVAKLLAAAYAKNEDAREDAAEALRNFGFDSRGEKEDEDEDEEED